MKLKSLIYIRDLLEENERKTRRAYEMAREAHYNAINQDADNVETLFAMHEKTHETWCKAWDALQDFESREW